MVDFNEVKKAANKEINDEKMKRYVAKYKELLQTLESCEKSVAAAKKKLAEFEKEPDKFCHDSSDPYKFVFSYTTASHSHTI